MASRFRKLSLLSLVFSLATTASAQSFRVQCPTSTITHPDPTNAGINSSEPLYNGPTQFTPASQTAPGWVVPTKNVNGAIKCQQISGGDGLMTEADGTQTFMFSFGPLSGLADVAAGRPSSQYPNVFNNPYPGTLLRGDPATTDGAASGAIPWTSGPTSPFSTAAAAFTWNGAVGLYPDIAQLVTITDLVQGAIPTGASAGTCPAPGPTTVTAWTDAPLGIPVNQSVVVQNAPLTGLAPTPTPGGYAGTWIVTCVANGVTTPSGFSQYAFQYNAATSPLAADTGNDIAAMAASPQSVAEGHVDPRPIMDVGVMNGNLPAPLAAFDEDDEFFLTLTNVGMIMRPDLFEQHTVHFHGYPNASSFYDGVPDASVAINIGASFTYYYLAPDAGTYFWHCHITPPEHLQMGMVGQLHVRPRQDRVPQGGSLYTYLGYQNGIGLPTGTAADLRTVCNPARDILCSATMPAVSNTVTQGLDLVGNPQRYTYNDGDGSTAYDVQYPIQMHGFDPNFHFVGMTFNPEMFVDMKDKYFLLNGRSYPDTVGQCGVGAGGAAPPANCVAGPQATITTDGQMHYSQPMPAVINIPVGGKALLRMVNLSVTEYHTLQSVGIPMKEVGFMAKLLRDQAGNNTEFYTNSITLGGGESLDVILDASDAGCSSFAGSGCSGKLYPAGSTFYLYTPQLDHLSNDAENFGGMMTEVHICNKVVPTTSTRTAINDGSTFGNTCN
jgi:Multicopper oxidase